MSAFYHDLPPEFRASADPTELITLWRGDKIGREVTGMLCRLGDPEQAQEETKKAVAGGTDGINELIDRHTDAASDSPLISVATAITRAQGYSSRPDETIYEIRLPAEKLIRDPYHIGSPVQGNDSELFVPGIITPADIIAFKTNNHDLDASELLEDRVFPGRTRPIRVIANPFLDREYRHDPSRKPNPAGTWDHSAHWRQAA